MKILRAAHLGMCFGVTDAITLARDLAAQTSVTVLGDLVHNPVVLADLERRGVRMARETDQVQTAHVLITAHGASDKRRRELATRGFRVHEATCPLVEHAHRVLRGLVREGYHPVIIGKRGHVEVRGLMEDFDEVDVVLTAEDVARLSPRARFGVIAQTTQPIERVRQRVLEIRDRFPQAEVRFVDTVCRPTKQRQWAAAALARECDVVIVVGGAHSNNTRELAATCRRYGARVHQVERAAEIDPAWLRDAKCVGLTAGTSTPDSVIDAVEQRLRTLAAQRDSEATRPVEAPASTRSRVPAHAA